MQGDATHSVARRAAGTFQWDTEGTALGFSSAPPTRTRKRRQNERRAVTSPGSTPLCLEDCSRW